VQSCLVNIMCYKQNMRWITALTLSSRMTFSFTHQVFPFTHIIHSFTTFFHSSHSFTHYVPSSTMLSHSCHSLIISFITFIHSPPIITHHVLSFAPFVHTPFSTKCPQSVDLSLGCLISKLCHMSMSSSLLLCLGTMSN